MKNTKLIGIIVIVACSIFSIMSIPAPKLRASSASITATVDKNEATLEDYIILSISVEGIRGKPDLPPLPDFNVVSQGSSSRVQIINGQMTSSVDYNYILYPKREGVFTIGPARLKYGGKTLTSNIITVTILRAQTEQRQNRDVFVTAEVNNKKPFLYQQIVYSFKFYHRVKVANAQLTDTPSFDGFLTEDLGKEKRYQKIINGQTYGVTEIKQALFPLRTGIIEISPSTLQCDIVVKKKSRRRFFNDPFFDDSFFGLPSTKTKLLRTSPITVHVKPLPAESMPADFSNLVGEFQLASTLSKEKLEVGESTTLTITLSGKGNIKSSQDIAVKKPEGFKLYSDKPAFEQQIIDGQIGGKLVVKKALVPLKEGILKIPPVSISYFNPEKGQYETVKTKPYMVRVSPSHEKEELNIVEAPGTPAKKEAIKILGKDILPIHTSFDALSPVKINPLSWISVLLFFLPIAGFFSFVVIKQQSEKYTVDQNYSRRKGAYKTFKKKMPIIKRALKSHNRSFYSEASKAFKTYIGDKLNITGAALTTEEFERRLADAGIKDETIQQMKEILEVLESGQFAIKDHPEEQKAAVLNTMQKVAKHINRKIK